MRTFAYTFDHFAELVDGLLDQLGVTRYAMYVMDYGAPVGWRLALKHPERVTGLIVQNGNAYEEGLKEFWNPIKAYWADGSERAPQGADEAGHAGDDEVPVHRRVSRRQPHLAGQLGARSGAARSARQQPTSRWTSSTTTGPTCRCIRRSRHTSASISRRR